MFNQIYNIDHCLESFEIRPGELFPHYDILPIDSKYYYSNYTRFRFNCGKKIAVVQCQSFTQLALDLSLFDLVIVFSKEWIPWPDYEDRLAKYYINSNILLVTGDKINNQNYFMVPWMLLEVGTPFNKFEDQNYSTSKENIFDILLGLKKPHRDYLFNQLKQSSLLTKSFVNYTSNNADINCKTIYRTPGLEKYETDQVCEKLNGGLSFHSYITGSHGVPFQQRESNRVPWKIYADSNYSVVAETTARTPYFNNDHFFPTEKTAKPLFAKRPFIVFGSANFLYNLNQLGFQTFDSIIDESYDQITDDGERWQAAWQSMLDLARKDSFIVYRKLKNVLDHNHWWIQNREHFIGPLRNWLHHRIHNL